MPELLIGDRPVGDGHPTYVIAEACVNHNGDFDKAKRMVDDAARTFRIERLVGMPHSPNRNPSLRRRSLLAHSASTLAQDVPPAPAQSIPATPQSSLVKWMRRCWRVCETPRLPMEWSTAFLSVWMSGRRCNLERDRFG